MDENEEWKSKYIDLMAYVEELKEALETGSKKNINDPFQDLLNKLLSAMKANNENEENNETKEISQENVFYAGTRRRDS